MQRTYITLCLVTAWHLADVLPLVEENLFGGIAQTAYDYSGYLNESSLELGFLHDQFQLKVAFVLGKCWEISALAPLPYSM